MDGNNSRLTFSRSHLSYDSSRLTFFGEKNVNWSHINETLSMWPGGPGPMGHGRERLQENINNSPMTIII